MGTKFDVYCSMENKYKFEITNKARRISTKMNSSIIYVNTMEKKHCKKPFKLIIAEELNQKPKMKEYHNEMKDAICEYSGTQSYYKESKKRIMTVYGYVRIYFGMRYYIDDIVYLITVYHIRDEDKITPDLQYQKKRIRTIEKIRKKGQHIIICGYMRYRMIYYHIRMGMRLKKQVIDGIADVVLLYLYDKRKYKRSDGREVRSKSKSGRRNSKKDKQSQVKPLRLVPSKSVNHLF